MYNNYFIIHKARRIGGSYVLKQIMEFAYKLIKPKPLLPILAKSLWLKNNGYKDNWYTNQLYKKACFDKLKQNLYYQIKNNL